MHWNTEQILWAAVMAGHLVLLVVLLGRDRAARFPWFTAGIAISTIRLLADHLLHGKLTTVAFYWQSYSSMLLDAIVGLFVLIELARAVFSSGKGGKILKAKGWLGGVFVTFALAIALVWYWGPWPTWNEINSEPSQVPLILVLLSALKGQLLIVILTVETGLLVQIFGPRFGFRWRSLPQLILIGLSTNALGFLALQLTTEVMKKNVHITSMEQRREVATRLNHLFTNLDNARFALWAIVLVWWIVWLWRDEPATGATLAGTLVLEPALMTPAANEVELESDLDSSQPS